MYFSLKGSFLDIFDDSEIEFQMFVPRLAQHLSEFLFDIFILMHCQCKTLLPYQPMLITHLICLCSQRHDVSNSLHYVATYHWVQIRNCSTSEANSRVGSAVCRTIDSIYSLNHFHSFFYRLAPFTSILHLNQIHFLSGQRFVLLLLIYSRLWIWRKSTHEQLSLE